ncbi:MAG TPA: cytochrome c maturation protein CcmE [Polyangiaceae bacterium]|jgi:cytochrome c-type biogenesis protein CcmE|nr:cytochrome c maturation protein CcmE [Polyangiaceae bacterium]
MSASNIDRELERAIAASPRGDADRVLQGRAVSGKGNLRLLVVLLVMGAGIVALVLTSFKDAAVYSKNVDQVMAEGRSLGGRQLRVEGNLVHGSLERRDQPCEYRFTIKGKEAQLPVTYAKCIVPDTFRDVPGMDVGVTVEGKVNAAGHFEATQVLAKCPSKYEMKEKQARGEEMPHQLPPSM